MKVKIDTKEKFYVLTICEAVLSANMTAEIRDQLLFFLEKDLKNIVIKMREVHEIDELVAKALVSIQQRFYDDEASFVICEINAAVEKLLDKYELLEVLNITPTESEAWDIVQLEEIERDLLK